MGAVMNRHTSLFSLMAIAAALGGPEMMREMTEGLNDRMPRIPREPKPFVPTKYDEERLAEAKLRRERKAAKKARQ